MTRTLPFDIAPTLEEERIGNERSGSFPLPIKRGLTPAEHQFIDQVEVLRSDFQIEMADLAIRVGEEKQIDPIQVYYALSNPQTEEDHKLRDELNVRYARETIALNQKARAIADQRRLLTATAIIKFRRDLQFTIEDMQAQGEHWINELYQFAQREQLDPTKPAEGEEEEGLTVEQLGK